MKNQSLKKLPLENTTTDWIGTIRQLGDVFAKRASEYDKYGEFVLENYQDLREHRLFSAGIPEELGGGGANYADMSNIIREIGRHCGSTALAFAMHTHPVAVNVYKHMNGDVAATKTLRKISAKELIIAGTGANDWLESSGEAERVSGGYRVSAHKRFVSGAPGAQIFVTSVIYSSPEGREILHFAIPFKSVGVRLKHTWNALGMRGTGSHDVVLEKVFVPETAVVGKRPAGVWHPMWNVVLPTALPLITSAYVGMAEAATELAKTAAKHRKTELAPVVGEMINSLTIAQLVLAEMVRNNDNHGFTPAMDLADTSLKHKSIVADAVKQTVELAAELVGGPGFLQGHAMERIVRDVRAMHYHPLPVRRQRIFTGRIALACDPISGK